MENKLFEDKALNILNRLEVLKSMYLRSEDYESLKHLKYLQSVVMLWKKIYQQN